MTSEDLEKFKNLLTQKKEELENALKSFADKDPNLKGDWDSKYPDFSKDDLNTNLEEEADEVEEYAARLPVEHSFELRLQGINEALARIKNGTYDKCAKCGADIPEKRLEAYPEAKDCLKCSS